MIKNYNGSGIDKNGKKWKWEFDPNFGPLFLGKKNEPLEKQPISRSHPAWIPFELWYYKFTHNKRHPLYRVWTDMKQRCGATKCTNSHNKRNYTDRNIVICKEWRDFIPFYRWAKNKWRTGLTIDRKDNNGDYTPDNCRFVTHKINCQNTRQSKLWCIGGEKFKSMRDAAKALKVSRQTIYNWCHGYISQGKFYQPKNDCFSIKRY